MLRQGTLNGTLDAQVMSTLGPAAPQPAAPAPKSRPLREASQRPSAALAAALKASPAAASGRACHTIQRRPFRKAAAEHPARKVPTAERRIRKARSVMPDSSVKTFGP